MAPGRKILPLAPGALASMTREASPGVGACVVIAHCHLAETHKVLSHCCTLRFTDRMPVAENNSFFCRCQVFSQGSFWAKGWKVSLSPRLCLWCLQLWASGRASALGHPFRGARSWINGIPQLPVWDEQTHSRARTRMGRAS